MTNSLTETEKAYLAGLVDGEGCITINRNKTSCGTPVYTMRVIITQANESYLHHWCNLVGSGTVYRQGNPGHNWWSWQMCDQQAAVFLRTIHQYVYLKADQLDIALKFIDTKNLGSQGGGGRRTPQPILNLQEQYCQDIAKAKEIGRVNEESQIAMLEVLLSSQLPLL